MTHFDHDRPVAIDPAERIRAEFRALARIRLTMAKILRAAGDHEGAALALAAARFWHQGSLGDGTMILRRAAL